MADRIRIVFVDTNEVCVNSLVERFDKELGDKVDKTIITSEEYIESFFLTPQSIDILIIDEQLYAKYTFRHGVSVRNIVLLTEEHVNADDAVPENVVARICKYQHMRDIYDTIIAASDVSIDTGDSGAKLIMVYSPVGGIGKTISALSLCRALANQKEHPLFISAETSQSFSAFVKNCGSASPEASRFIKEPALLFERSSGMIGKDKFDYIQPLECCPSALGLSGRSYISLLQALKNSGKYSHIVFDAPSDFTLETAEMMSVCDRIVVITGQDYLSVLKTRRMLNNAVFDNNRFVFVCNHFNENEKDYNVTEANGEYNVSIRLKNVSCSNILGMMDVMSEQNGMTELVRAVR